MHNHETIALPYAKAIFGLAKLSEVEKWVRVMEVLSIVVCDADILELSKHPLVRNEDVANLIVGIVCSYIERKQIANIASISEKLKNFVILLLSSDRLAIVPSVLKHLIHFINIQNKSCSAVIRTAFPLDENQKSELHCLLSKKFGKCVSMKVTLDRSLIGGVEISVNGQIFDFSVKGRLKKLESVFFR